MWGRELPWVLSEQLGLGPRACDEKPGQHQSGKRAQAPRCVIWLALASVLDSRLLGAGPCQAQEGLAAAVGDRACEGGGWPWRTEVHPPSWPGLHGGRRVGGLRCVGWGSPSMLWPPGTPGTLAAHV